MLHCEITSLQPLIIECNSQIKYDDKYIEEKVSMARKTEKLYEDFSSLMSEIQAKDDPREAFAIVQDRIQEYRSAGWAVPDDLVRVERTMMTDFMSESQGR